MKTKQLRMILFSLLSIIYGCSENKDTSNIPFTAQENPKLKIYYTYPDSFEFSNTNPEIELWNLLYDSEKMKGLSQLPVLNGEWVRIEWEKGTKIDSVKSFMKYLLLPSSNVSSTIYSNSGILPPGSYTLKDSISGQPVLLLSKFINSNPDCNFLAIHNNQVNMSSGEGLDRKRQLSPNILPQNLHPDQKSLVTAVKTMDSLLIRNDIGQLGKYLAHDYSDDGVLKDDKIRLYQYIATKMEKMRFEYGNFTFFNLKDGRVKLVYDYRMFEGDSIWDLGFEERYFQKKGSDWKETGNKSRFYTSTLTSKYIKGDANFQIYLPPQYFKFPKTTFPVIYVFNEFKDLTSDWIAYNFDEIMDSLISKKAVEPSIIIFMDGGPSLYMKSSKPDGYDFETFFITEAGPNFDTVLRITKQRERRYLTGFGQGGLAAMYYLLKYPTVFYSAATVNGVFKFSLQAKHMDQGNPDYWNDKYPQYFVKMMPDYILKNLHFKLIQNPDKKTFEGFTEFSALVMEKKADVETSTFKDTWQEHLEWISKEAFGWHMQTYRKYKK